MAMENLAPIVLFVYNRTEHTKNTIEALKRNDLAKQSELFIYSDAAKKEEDIEKVTAVREYIKHIDGFKAVNIVERKTNFGLAKSIVEGVTDIVSQYGKIIVLEDDLVTKPGFLTYMNEGLDKYQSDSKVYSVSGYSYLRDAKVACDTYFLKICSSWSWATWKDRWEQFDLTCTGWECLKKDRKLRKCFNFDYCYPFYSLLKRQMTNRETNSWAIKWYWTVFKNNGLTLYPTGSLINNSGFDGSGEHCSSSKKQWNNGENDKKSLILEEERFEKSEVRKLAVKSIRKTNSLGEKIQNIKDVLK